MPLFISRKSKWLSFVLLLGIMALMTACASQRIEQPKWCPVPVQTARLEYDLPPDCDGRQRVCAKALDDAVCLVRTGKVEKCKDPQATPPVCDLRSKEEVRELLEPAFDVIVSLELKSAYSINDKITNKIPDAIPMTRVRDARRTFDCTEWKKEKPCVAFKYDILWFLLKRTAGGTGVADYIEIFLAEPACKKDIR